MSEGTGRANRRMFFGAVASFVPAYVIHTHCMMDKYPKPLPLASEISRQIRKTRRMWVYYQLAAGVGAAAGYLTRNPKFDD